MADSAPGPVSPAGRLCLSCGLCCNGGIHNWTNLRQHEVTPMRLTGLQVFQLPQGTPAFQQPCAAYKDPACTIYTQRPQACREYECRLYQSLQSGQIDLETALQHTRRARELIAVLRSHMLELDDTLPLERQVRYQWHRSEPPAAAAAVLHELVELLRTRFGVRWSPGGRK